MAFVHIACVVATSVLMPVEGARADDLLFSPVQGSRAVEPCNPFADELDDGTASCMRFGGRVRVDLGAQGPVPADKGYGAAPAAVRVDGGSGMGGLDLPGRPESGLGRSHLRLPNPGAAGTFDPYAAR